MKSLKGQLLNSTHKRLPTLTIDPGRSKACILNVNDQKGC